MTNKILKNFSNKLEIEEAIKEGKNVMASCNLRTAPNSFNDGYWSIAIDPKDKSYFDIKLETFESLCNIYGLDSEIINGISEMIKEKNVESISDILESSFPEINTQYDILKIINK